MADIKDQLIKDSYNYVLQSDLTTGVIYRIGGSVPIFPTFISGLTVNSGFTYSNGTEQNGYVLTCDSSGNANWEPSGEYLPLSGGTVTGGTIFQSGLTANTISATTYYNLPTDIFVTGGTYNSGDVIFTNNTGGTFTVTGFAVGGGGGQTFYLNLSQSQNGNRLLSTTGSTSSEQTSGVTIGAGATSTISSFESRPLNITLLPGGIWSFYLHSYKENNNASFNIFVELYKRTSGGTQTLLFSTDPTPVTTNSPNPSMQLSDGYFSGTTLLVSDSIVATVRATNTSNQSHIITLVTEGSTHYSYVVSTIPTQQGISGSGTSNYLPKWSSSTSLVNSLVYDSSTGVTIGTGFTWNNTNSRLGIGTTTPAYKFEVRDTGASSVTHFLGFKNDGDNYGGITIGSGSGQNLTIQQNTGYGYLAATGFRIGSANGVIWTNNGSIFRIVDPATEATNYLRIASTTGNVLINTGTDAGYKLDVNGTARVSNSVTALSYLGNADVQFGLVPASGANTYVRLENTGLVENGILFNTNNSSNNFKFRHSTNYTFTLGYQNTSAAWFGSNTSLVTVNASAQVQIDSTTKGFLPPRMTTSQKNAITSPATGLTVYDNTINETQTYNGSAWITKRNGVEVYQSPLFINTHIAATGNTNTVLYGSPYPLTVSTNGNIIKINAIFQAKQTSVNTFIRVYASTSPTTLSGGAVQLGNFALTAANAASGLDTIGYDKTFILTNDSGSYQIITVNSFGTNTDISPESLNTASIGSGVISYPYICITLNQGAVLHSVTINYSR
jgi:hypothetical protein